MISFMSILQLNINNFSSSRKEVWSTCEMVTAALLTEHIFLDTQHLISGSRLFLNPHTEAKKATYGLCFDTESKLQGNNTILISQNKAKA